MKTSTNHDTAGSGYIVTWPPDKRIAISNGSDSFWNQDFPQKIWKSRNKFVSLQAILLIKSKI